MFSFYTIVIIIAIIILVLALTAVGITLASNKNNKPFPEYQNTCPDFWTLDGNVCKPNEINIPLASKIADAAKHPGVNANVTGTTASIISIDLNEDNWVGICDKASWAKKYGILWDGVTNNNTCV